VVGCGFEQKKPYGWASQTLTYGVVYVINLF
jgi:hypothetical protein